MAHREQAVLEFFDRTRRGMSAIAPSSPSAATRGAGRKAGLRTATGAGETTALTTGEAEEVASAAGRAGDGAR